VIKAHTACRNETTCLNELQQFSDTTKIIFFQEFLTVEQSSPAPALKLNRAKQHYNRLAKS
jgi:hypothetical protein